MSDQNETVCALCDTDYGEPSCLVAGACPDCLDNTGELEDLLEAALESVTP